MPIILLLLSLKLGLESLKGPAGGNIQLLPGVRSEILALALVNIEILAGLENHSISSGFGQLLDNFHGLLLDGLHERLLLLLKLKLDGL